MYAKLFLYLEGLIKIKKYSFMQIFVMASYIQYSRKTALLRIKCDLRSDLSRSQKRTN